MVDGKRANVTPNLAKALADVQPTLGDLSLWVDALRIDQDNVLERNHQVKKMATISQKASRVHVWLGRPDAENPPFILFLQHLSRFLSESIHFPGQNGETETFLTAIHDQYRAKWASLATSTELPYWSRLWIVQEIGLASDILVHHGSTSINWTIFARMRK
jgi:hypothetical protein